MENMVELKKDSLMQRQSGDVKIGFTIQHADMPDYLFSAPMGKRFYVVFVDADDYDEQNGGTEQKEIGTNSSDKTEGEKLRTRAVLLCQETDFKNFIFATSVFSDTEEGARQMILRACEITSRSKLATDIHAQDKFKALLEKYKDWQFEQQHKDNLAR